jgi:hypothetical protein
MAVDLSNPELESSWKNLTRHESSINWILFGFENNTNKLYVVASGSGGIEELKSKLDESQVQFAAFRVVGVDNRETTVSRRPKFIYISYVGPKVGVLKKARVSVMKPDLARFFQSSALNLEISDASELTKYDVSKRLLASGGAHKYVIT